MPTILPKLSIFQIYLSSNSVTVTCTSHKFGYRPCGARKISMQTVDQVYLTPTGIKLMLECASRDLLHGCSRQIRYGYQFSKTSLPKLFCPGTLVSLPKTSKFTEILNDNLSKRFWKYTCQRTFLLELYSLRISLQRLISRLCILEGER